MPSLFSRFRNECIAFCAGAFLVSLFAHASGSALAPQIFYSLDQKRNDEEIVRLIDLSEKYAYFAIYTFTKQNIADALVRAKERGVEVRGIIDRDQGASSFGRPIVATLEAGGISVEKQIHVKGIMHIKALVTEKAYAIGSYNWTQAATISNDEVLEIGRDPATHDTYRDVLLKVFEANKASLAAGFSLPGSASSTPKTISGSYPYTDAKNHVGEYVEITGTLVNLHLTKSGTLFLDFCKNYKTCPFSAVVLNRDRGAFSSLADLEGKEVALRGSIKLYQNKPEIVLSHPEDIGAKDAAP